MLPTNLNFDIWQGQDFNITLTGAPLSIGSGWQINGFVSPFYIYPQSGSNFLFLSGNTTGITNNVDICIPAYLTYNLPGSIGYYEVDAISGVFISGVFSGQAIIPVFAGNVNIYPSIRYAFNVNNI